jgi:hypothetical protein
VIDTKSVDTGYDTFNEHIQGEDFLDTAKYPTATFKSTKVIFEGDKPAKVEGNLTLKGVTKPVTLTVTSFQAMPHPMLKKDAIGANATPSSSAPNSTPASTPVRRRRRDHRRGHRSDQGVNPSPLANESQPAGWLFCAALRYSVPLFRRIQLIPVNPKPAIAATQCRATICRI